MQENLFYLLYVDGFWVRVARIYCTTTKTTNAKKYANTINTFFKIHSIFISFLSLLAHCFASFFLCWTQDPFDIIYMSMFDDRNGENGKFISITSAVFCLLVDEFSFSICIFVVFFNFSLLMCAKLLSGEQKSSVPKNIRQTTQT